jgi:hypothetical protein
MDVLIEGVLRIGFWPVMALLGGWGLFNLLGTASAIKKRRADAESHAEEKQSDAFEMLIAQSGADRERFDKERLEVSATLLAKLDLLMKAIAEFRIDLKNFGVGLGNHSIRLNDFDERLSLYIQESTKGKPS